MKSRCYFPNHIISHKHGKDKDDKSNHEGRKRIELKGSLKKIGHGQDPILRDNKKVLNTFWLKFHLSEN